MAGRSAGTSGAQRENVIWVYRKDDSAVWYAVLVTEAQAKYALRPVDVPGFSGPLDLLLLLIEEGKLDVNTIALAMVTEQYLARVRTAGALPPEHLAEFLVVAATLLLIKSRKLFPDFSLTEEEEERIASLEEQLREYRRFRTAAKQLLQQWPLGPRTFPRESFLGMQATFYPPSNVGVEFLAQQISGVVQRLPKLELLTKEILRRVVSIEERIKDIQRRVQEEAQTTFQALADTTGSKGELIVSFLALLELVKRRLISVRQRRAFHDIVVARSGDERSGQRTVTTE